MGDGQRGSRRWPLPIYSAGRVMVAARKNWRPGLSVALGPRLEVITVELVEKGSVSV